MRMNGGLTVGRVWMVGKCLSLHLEFAKHVSFDERFRVWSPMMPKLPSFTPVFSFARILHADGVFDVSR
jgi:hypothetical protein